MKAQSLPHDSAKGHVSGESEFIDDRPLLKGEVHVGILYSPVAHGILKNIDLKKASALPGIVGLFTAKDFVHNTWGPIVQDQPLLAYDKILYLGEPLVVIAAEDTKTLALAKSVIHLEIEELPPILSIDEAKHQQFFLGESLLIQTGNATEALQKSPHRLSGVFESAGQEHFYLESQAAIAYPMEGQALEIHSSSQHPTEVQHVTAHALGLPYHQVVSIVKRMGGGFGGKESQASHMAALAALVAHKTRRPARLILNKDDDMKMTGKRHPFKNCYEVGFDDEGKILGLKVELFSNGGAYTDLSPAVLQRAMLHIDNAYFLPNADITGRICRTHNPPNTAFRGFGGPQGVATIENIIEEISLYLGKDSLQIRKINCYQSEQNNKTPYGQEVTNNTLPRLFKKLEISSQYQKRRKEIREFNQASSTHLRGLSLTAVKFGISFTARFLNQGNALVNIHSDGTLQVSTGAAEMGQGVNTKIQQIVSECFSIDPTNVRIMPTSTDKNHNTSATAASSGSDINGAAALLASQKIKKRLMKFAAQFFKKDFPKSEFIPMEEILVDEENDRDIPTDHILFQNGFILDREKPQHKISFAELVKRAYFHRISLGDYAYFKTPHLFYDKEKGQGRPFLYYTNGVAATEVSIDRYTGELKILRTDILMDLGRPINEGIDFGQISGAFVQGAGWVTTEDLFYSAKGELLSHSPTTYKIPSIQDIPRIFNIDLIENTSNIVNVRGSKAVGEPPFLLSISIWTAAKQAIGQLMQGEIPRFKLPATPEEILKTISSKNDFLSH